MRMCRAVRLFIGLVLVGALAGAVAATMVPSVRASETAAANGVSATHVVAPLHYKSDVEGGFGSLIIRVVGALLLVSAVGLGAVHGAKRLMPGVRGYSHDGKRRVQLLETHRITPRLTLFVISYEGEALLLAQSGDRVIHIDRASDTRAIAHNSSGVE
jgi:uncharacterized membrane protein YeaQ/YmgE (transglycosylase-associated protein family)